MHKVRKERMERYKMKLNLKTIIQYFLLYLIFISHGAALTLNNSFEWGLVLFIVGLMVVMRYCYQLRYAVFFLVGAIVAGIILTRFINGGVGIGVIIKYVGLILCACAAVLINRKSCATRFVKLIVFFSLFSFPYFVIFNIKIFLWQILIFNQL